jgi:hypothetical protein
LDLFDPIGKFAAVFVTTALGSGVGAYLGSYLKKKGENLATHEDIDKLIHQVSAVTDATETIKAQIGSDLWTRQIVWQQKRDAYAKILNVSHALRESLIDLSQAFRASERSVTEEQRKATDQNFGAAQNRYYLELAPALSHEIDIGEIFLGHPAVKVLNEFRNWRQSAESGTDFQDRVDFVAAWRTRLIEAARKDLGVPE